MLADMAAAMSFAAIIPKAVERLWLLLREAPLPCGNGIEMSECDDTRNCCGLWTFTSEASSQHLTAASLPSQPKWLRQAWQGTNTPPHLTLQGGRCFSAHEEDGEVVPVLDLVLVDH